MAVGLHIVFMQSAFYKYFYKQSTMTEGEVSPSQHVEHAKCVVFAFRISRVLC